MSKDDSNSRGEHAESERNERTKGQTFRLNEDELPDGPPEAIDASTEQASEQHYEPVSLGRKHVKGLKWFAILSLIYVSALLLYKTYELADQIWGMHWILGAAFMFLVAALLIATSVTLRAWLTDNDKLSSIHSFQHQARRFREQRTHGQIEPYVIQLAEFYRGKPQADSYESMQALLPDYADDQEALKHIENHFLSKLDTQALACIKTYSSQTGVAVALSPWASMDMLLTLWRNIVMIEEIAKTYGIRPSYPNKLKILLQVLNNMAFAGSSQLALDYLASVSDNNLMLPLVGRAGQGLGSTLISVRIGLSAVHQCRPVPFSDSETPKLNSLMASIARDVFARLSSIDSLKSGLRK
ncbi:MAG: TIGR01620 family protein [Motiliproteus sp.]